MRKLTFHIAKMDCPCEEQMIRMKLQPISEVKQLQFDLTQRTLVVYHNTSSTQIVHSLEELNLGARLLNEEESNAEINQEQGQQKILWTVLAINFAFFLIEVIFGIFSHSMGLVADSLDMLADALVYGLALFAVYRTTSTKKNVAKIAGYLQITLAVIGFIEVLRRVFSVEQMPEFQTMIIVSALALIANFLCLYLLKKGESNEAHIQASMIFTSNDILINLGVIVAGILVTVLDSVYPDLIIGSLVFLLVIKGAWRILQLAK